MTAYHGQQVLRNPILSSLVQCRIGFQRCQVALVRLNGDGMKKCLSKGILEIRNTVWLLFPLAETERFSQLRCSLAVPEIRFGFRPLRRISLAVSATGGARELRSRRYRRSISNFRFQK